MLPFRIEAFLAPKYLSLYCKATTLESLGTGKVAFQRSSGLCPLYHLALWLFQSHPVCRVRGVSKRHCELLSLCAKFCGHDNVSEQDKSM